MIAITGTPGTGKSTVGKALRSRGYEVIDLGRLIEEGELLGELDPVRDTHEVDLDALDELVREKGGDEAIVVGHLAHCLSVDRAVVLRCRPPVLEERLRARGWSEAKIRENLEAEACDIILVESLEEVDRVFEIDVSSMGPEQVLSAVEDILKGRGEDYAPGQVDWSEEVMDWF
ncbi:MAG: adenylate kinase family protein [Methanomassiliicoccales archaeon]